MAERRDSLEVWTRVSSAGDVLSLASSSERLPGDAQARRDSEDAVTSPLTAAPASSAPAWSNDGPEKFPAEMHREDQTAPRQLEDGQNSKSDDEFPRKIDACESDASMEEEDSRAQPRPLRQPEREAADVSEGGWWASIATSVKRVAEGVSHDIEEINESIQKLLDEDDGRDSQESGVSQADSELERNSTPEREAESESPETKARKEEILSRLEGKDTEFEAGMKAIDAQVEQLSSGLGKAFGSLWGSARGAVTFSQRMAQQMEAVAKEMGTQVEAGVREGQRGLSRAANTTTSLTSALASRAEQGLAALGQRALDTAGTAEGGWPAEQSFRRQWQACGGQQSLEELEALGNESARACTSLFNRLEPAARERFKTSLEGLVASFDLSQQPKGEADSQPGEAERCTAAEAALNEGHRPVAELQQAAIRRAAGLAEQLPETRDEDIPEEAAEMMQLRQACSEGGRLLAELCAACVERLLALGKSLAASSGSARPSSDGVHWPPQPASSARLLRKEAALLMEALRSVAEAFVDGISRAADSAAARAPSQKSTLLELSDSLCTALERDLESGLAWIQEAFKGLVYVAALSGKERAA